VARLRERRRSSPFPAETVEPEAIYLRDGNVCLPVKAVR
jgi:hypothetical protein